MSIQPHKLGHWLPQDHHWTSKWLSKLIKHAAECDKELKPELRDLKNLVDSDVELKILAFLMFVEVPQKDPLIYKPGQCQVHGFDHALELINDVMDSGPTWDIIADQVGLIGFPINLILEWPMCTSSGNAFFLRRDVNEHFARILNRWTVYLSSPFSTGVLTTEPDGWLNDDALGELTAKGNNGGMTDYIFEQLYKCDSNKEHYGFTSWDNFFVREFQDVQDGGIDVRPLGGPPYSTAPLDRDHLPGMPIGGPSDEDAIIYNACESAFLYIRREDDVNEKSVFWIKSQPYSLADMLVNDPFTPRFVGGTVYQAFLSALSYHRWHSPVSGTIVRAFNVPGTYYSANYFEGYADPDGPDPAAPDHSQAYITQVAARAVIFIQADDQRIGLVGFIAVGMAECSSNEITVVQGQKVAAGDQIGMFHFGGSTHCLLFETGVNVSLTWEIEGKPPPDHNVPLKSRLATVMPPSRK